MTIHDVLHDIVKLLPHRQEILDELHASIDIAELEAQLAGRTVAPAAPTEAPSA